MAYRVKITPRAQRDIEELYQWVIRRAPHQGILWYEGLIQSIKSLAHHPKRCPLAPEGLELRESVRQLLYGKRPYKIFFLVKGSGVHILHIRRGARRPWNLGLVDTDCVSL